VPTGLIVERMDRPATDQLLSEVPLLHSRLVRMIVEGVARAGGADLAAKLKTIAETPKTDPEIVALAGRFFTGSCQWPSSAGLNCMGWSAVVRKMGRCGRSSNPTCKAGVIGLAQFAESTAVNQHSGLENI
jgi:hypothetical protein